MPTTSANLPHAWLREIVASPVVRELIDRLDREGHVLCEGAWGSSTALIAGALAANTRRPVLFVVAHLDDADDALGDLELFPAAGVELNPHRFGALEILPGESAVSLELLAERLAVVEQIARKKGQGPRAEGQGPRDQDNSRMPDSRFPTPESRLPTPDSRLPIPDARFPNPASPLFLIAPIQGLMQSVPQPGTLNEFFLTLTSGATMPPGQLLDWLDRAGYKRADAVEHPGDFATRGGIIDIYAPSGTTGDNAQDAAAGNAAGGPAAIRLDFFGDDIDSINLIDMDTMGSGKKVPRFQIIGAAVERLQSDERTTNLLELLPKDTIVVMQEALELAEQARGYYERLTDPRGIYSPQGVLKLLTKRQHVQIDQFSAGSSRGKGGVLRLPVRQLAPFDKDAATAVKEISDFGLKGEKISDYGFRIADLKDSSPAPPVVVLCQKPAERDRLLELIREHAPHSENAVTLDIGYLHRGFIWTGSQTETASRHAQNSELRTQNAEPRTQNPAPTHPDSRLRTQDSGLILVPHHELFHRYHTHRRIRKLGAAAQEATDAFFDLDVGDFVVHEDHGIAQFTGLRTMKREGKTEDYLTLTFAEGALLHVPATEIELVQKYIGGFSGRPPLSHLGGKRWEKQKDKTREAVKDMAAQMLRIQAARASLPGLSFPADTPWQKEFEAEFPYDETEDQLAAIAAMKRDMSGERPMDRLLCGDVGFGKTEVAIRGAFKAAEFGKQVAVLVPTTVLAEQHERTFHERMADYPFRVASLSRFKTDKEQNDTLAAVARGEVDIVIGTHRLLSKDVKFADLGLVIIDEEQRFGVEHKNKLLEFRLTADVLTMTATPIPRTLHMSLLGLRDISSLSTPPVDRRAVVTEVIPYDKQRIRHAIVRELNRDGQTFFVHNRVHNIEAVANEVRSLVPEAKVIVGHGQMGPRELEAVMLKFVRREADVLVCTTIIESGIDIPTANTMFINNADHFGLAELHQLRGRVGRYKHRAYCYLMLPEDRPITDKAVQRLKAIEQFSMLGAGFKIAMRDLEIRGAGNLLGSEQSGHIAAVGYQMYCTLLEQEAKRMRNEKLIEPVKTHIELPAVGRLLPSYIASDKHRMDAYRRLSRASSLAELDAVERAMTEAYGKAPAPAQTLIDLTEIRIAASTHDIEAIKLDGPDIIFRTRHPQTLDALMKDAPGRVSLIDDRTVYFRPPPKFLEEPATILAVLRKILVRPLRT